MPHQKCLGWTDIAGDRSPQCKPLGGQSSWASVGGAGEGGRETVFAVAGMDSTAMFHDRAPGEINRQTTRTFFFWVGAVLPVCVHVCVCVCAGFC